MNSTKLIKALLYILLALVSVLLFSLLMLPEDKLQTLVERGLARGLGGDYRVEIGDFDVGLLGGVEARNVMIRPIGAGSDAGALNLEQRIDARDRRELARRVAAADGAPAQPAAASRYPQCETERDTSLMAAAPTLIQSVELDTSLFGALGAGFGGGLDVPFALKVGGGSVTGHFANDPDAGTAALDFQMTPVPFEVVPLVRQMLGVDDFADDFLGLLNASGNIVFGPDAPQSGEVQLNITEVTFCDLLIKQGESAAPLGHIKLGDIVGTIAFEEGVARLQEIPIEGGDIRGRLSGYYAFPESGTNSARWDIQLRLEFDDVYAEENNAHMVMKTMGCKRFNDGAYQFVFQGRTGQEGQSGCVRGPSAPQRGASDRSTRSTARPAPPPPAPEAAPTPRAPEPEPVPEPAARREPAPRTTRPQLAPPPVRAGARPAPLPGRVEDIPVGTPRVPPERSRQIMNHVRENRRNR